MAERKKVVCQLQRARKLADWFTGEYLGDPAVALEMAEAAPDAVWELLGEELGFEHPASDDTVALTVELLAWRAEPFTITIDDSVVEVPDGAVAWRRPDPGTDGGWWLYHHDSALRFEVEHPDLIVWARLNRTEPRAAGDYDSGHGGANSSM